MTNFFSCPECGAYKFIEQPAYRMAFLQPGGWTQFMEGHNERLVRCFRCLALLELQDSGSAHLVTHAPVQPW